LVLVLLRLALLLLLLLLPLLPLLGCSPLLQRRPGNRWHACVPW
jgi:hypothetical protein